jgi:hypothetical protein
MEMELLKKLCGKAEDASCLKTVKYTSGEPLRVAANTTAIESQ